MRRPLEKSSYEDSFGRKLRIRKVNLKDYQDRHIQGEIRDGDFELKDYSCSLQIWADIWRDRAPSLDPNKMKIG